MGIVIALSVTFFVFFVVCTSFMNESKVNVLSLSVGMCIRGFISAYLTVMVSTLKCDQTLVLSICIHLCTTQYEIEDSSTGNFLSY